MKSYKLTRVHLLWKQYHRPICTVAVSPDNFRWSDKEEDIDCKRCLEVIKMQKKGQTPSDDKPV